MSEGGKVGSGRLFESKRSGLGFYFVEGGDDNTRLNDDRVTVFVLFNAQLQWPLPPPPAPRIQNTTLIRMS